MMDESVERITSVLLAVEIGGNLMAHSGIRPADHMTVYNYHCS